MGVNMGWCSDYPDPYDWINILLYGGSRIQAENNVNYSYFNDPKWNKKMEKAARLVGPNRLKVYGQLDLDVMNQAAPMAIERTYNNRYIFSNRVNPKSLVYQGIYQDFAFGLHGPEVGGTRKQGTTREAPARAGASRAFHNPSYESRFPGGRRPDDSGGADHVFRYLVRRILWADLLFIVITFVTFVIFYVGPNNPARAVCGGEQAKRECLVQATAKLGLDQPMPVQYGKFLKQLVLHADLGESFATSQSVNQRIKEAAPVTASLVFGGAVLWMMIGLSVGIFSALEAKFADRQIAMVFVLIGVSAHPVWIGLIFEYVFGVKLGWTPIANYANFFGAPSRLRAAGRALAVVLPPDPAVVHLRAAVRGALRAHDPRQRDRDAERGLRPNRARQGRARGPGHQVARAAERAAAGRDDARDGHRDRARRGDLHGDRLTSSRASARPRSSESTTRTSRSCRA